MSIEITFDQAKELIDRAIQEKGAEYVYKPPKAFAACVYFDLDRRKPSCIVGHALSYLGVTADQAYEWNDGIAASDLDASDLRVLSFADKRASAFLDKVQELQDCETPWGEARDEALAHVAQLGPELDA